MVCSLPPLFFFYFSILLFFTFLNITFSADKYCIIGKFPPVFRENPLQRYEKSRYFAPEKENNVEQLKTLQL